LSDETNTKFPTELAVKTFVNASAAAGSEALSEEIDRATAAEMQLAEDLEAETIRANAAELENTLAIATINTLETGKVYLGNAGNEATEVAITGDVTLDNSGVSTIGEDKVVTNMIADANVTDAKLDKENIPLSGFGAAGADVALGENKLTGVADPTLAQDAATKNYVDTGLLEINSLQTDRVYVGNSENIAAEIPTTGTGDVVRANSATLNGTVTANTLNANNVSATALSGNTVSGTSVSALNLTSSNNTFGQVTVSGALGVTGPTTLGSLEITGAATLISVTVTNNATIGGTLGVDGVIVQSLTPSLPVFTDGSNGLVSNPITGTGSVVLSDSPTLTGIPIAPTAAIGTNSSQIATTAYVDAGLSTINSLESGSVYLGNIENQAAEVTLSGDITLSNTGVSTIGESRVVSTMIADETIMTADIHNDAVTTAKIADDNVTTVKILDANVTTEKIADANVTDAKLDKANIPLSGFGSAVADVSLGEYKLTAVADPTQGQDAATKNYVDGKVSDLTTGSESIQTELDATQTGAGLGTDGSYTANTESNFLKTANSLQDADEKLDAQVNTNATDISTKAPLASPTFTGTPTAPTALEGSSSTQIATTAFVHAGLLAINTLDEGKVYLGNSEGEAAEVSITGDVTLNSTGLSSIGESKVTSNMIADETIMTADLHDDVVTTAKIADANVTTEKILDGTIINADVSTTAAIEGTKITPDFGDQNLSTTGTIKTGAITLPNTDGTTGQVLTTDGAGLATWLTPSIASSDNFVDLTSNQFITGNKTFRRRILFENESWGNKATMTIGFPRSGYNLSGLAIGINALDKHQYGVNAIAIGNEALFNDLRGSDNIGIGFRALYNLKDVNNEWGNSNVAIGKNAGNNLVEGDNNTLLGSESNTSTSTISNASAIGYQAVVSSSNSIQLGNAAITDVKTSGTLTAGEVTYPKTHGTTGQVLSTTGTGSLTWVTTSSAPSVMEVADEFTATASQTSFTLAQTPSVNSKVKMYVNGIRISNTAYSVVGTALTYNPANNGSYTLAAGDRIQMDFYY
ncbi:hypothetical protein, partial [Cyclobacterium sp. SYSU L10401]|uniref:beta strand repeat-containing protein n=1 Tax=Cyclobacterium sp. SYSU L10401 TaxID=2678657 RepID=UPI0013D130A2